MPEVTCIHHWVIAPAQYAQPSKGVCKKCKLEKVFQNSIATDDNPWTKFTMNHEGEAAYKRRRAW
jgi:hypothetical protein